MAALLRGEPHPWYARTGRSPPTEGRPPQPATIDPIAVAVDLCEFRESCQSCGRPIRCLQAAWPAFVTLADCRACVQRSEPSP